MNFTKKDYKYFEMARQEALKSDFGSIKIGSVLVYKKHVIGSGFNSNKTHPKQMKYNKKRKFNKSTAPVKHSLHAEIMAIESVPYPVAASINWSDVKIYTYRICPGKPLGHGIARPCAGCRAAMKDKGIRHIYYTGDSSFIYERTF